MVDGAAGSGSEARYFSEDEVRGLTPELVRMLDRARGLAHVPFHITSGLRTAGQNADAGGVHESSHLRGYGVDIACFDSRARMRMVSALIVAGFRRIGIYSRHLHADCDESLPQDVLWFGGESH